MNNPKSLFTRTAILLAFFVLATSSHFSANAQTRLSKNTPIMKADKVQANTINSNTWYFEGLKMSSADERAFLSLLKQVDPRAYSVKEVARGNTVRKYGKTSPAQVQLVKKTIVNQNSTRAKGGIIRHKVHTDDKFSESTIIWVSAAGVNTDIVKKINGLMAKYQGVNVVNVKNAKNGRMTLRQK